MEAHHYFPIVTWAIMAKVLVDDPILATAKITAKENEVPKHEPQ